MRFLPNNSLPNLKSHYVVILESALIVSLSTFIALFKMPIEDNSANRNWSIPDSEILHISSVMPLELHKQIPEPPTLVPIPIPTISDVVIEQELKNIDVEFYNSDYIELPPKDITIGPERKILIVERPVLIGGLTKLQKNIKYPRKALKDQVQGRVILRFIVDKKGHVQNPEIVKGVRNDINEEALRAISESRFKPARKNGKAVNVEHLISILFRIEMRSASVGMN